ncbi:MAG: MBL fold metallo-hydrolase [Proteobacteria bacterium]|nr:MBL fold metallo-hydrolase [Pseudomonadota bacterium]MBU1687924.1 MBL fold metallo-hydrolase [Pseudomonadota bacterium]
MKTTTKISLPRLKLGEFEINWLPGGVFDLDGGCMFGVVPRALWAKKFPADPEGFISLTNTPILVRTPDALLVIDTGLGNKLSEKQKKIFRVTQGWRVEEGLGMLGLSRHDIDHVILTHCDFDHAGGVVMYGEKGMPSLTFPNAVHHVQRTEWDDVLQPNRRSACSYWNENLDLLKSSDRLNLVDESLEPVAGIALQRTGGHTMGHQVVWLKSGEEIAVHPGDLLPNHAYFNPLWVTPYDNFPLESVAVKEKLIPEGIDQNAWFLMYHDPTMAACRFDREGNVVERV